MKSTGSELEKFYRNNIKPIVTGVYTAQNPIDIHIISWHQNDELDETGSVASSDRCKYCNKNEDWCKCDISKYTIRCFGVTQSGNSVTCKINGYNPVYYIKVSDTFDNMKLYNFLEWLSNSWICKKYPTSLVKKACKLVKRKDLFGFRGGKEYVFIKLVFNNYTALMRSRYLFKKPIIIPRLSNQPVKYKLYESNFEPYMRFCHEKDIKLAGWIRLPVWCNTYNESTTQLEVELNWDDIIGLNERLDIGDFLQASFDIETYSYDKNFPDPNKQFTIGGKVSRPNEIFQIATTFKYYKDSDVLTKQLLTLKTCNKLSDPGVILVECKNERELIKTWIDTISVMDPDILYTYNGDSFDCNYIYHRAKLCGLEDYLMTRISRLCSIKTVIKDETFNSSAYGYSNYHRFYIPGRLNYDLLIHYIRGMTKYSSYKLNNIANEILGEGKHDLDAVTMFSYYETGDPEKIRKIAEYCVVDTTLLQKLVDKQLILPNIIQLANVTYVPIEFQTTRGQTIKVYSQLLRKSKQMGFLVPHTNFNEDIYPVLLKFRDPHPFSKDNIGKYLEMKRIEITTVKDNGETKTDFRDINGKISEIIDENCVVVLCDTELTSDQFNKRAYFNNTSIQISRMSSNCDETNDGFSGASVLEARPSLYTENVVILDFASLYPTIMIAWNLCYSTFLIDPKYNNLPGVKYERLVWDDKVEYKMRHVCKCKIASGKNKGVECGKQAYFDIPVPDNWNIESDGEWFNFRCKVHDPMKKTRSADEKKATRDVHYDYTIVQTHTDSDGKLVNQGVLPALLEELYTERKNVKKLMSQAKERGDYELAQILDSTQLAIKISLNSTYGFLGRGQGNLVLKELASIVTSNGRKLLERSKEYSENEFVDYLQNNDLLVRKLETVSVTLSKPEQQNFLSKFLYKAKSSVKKLIRK